MNQRLQRYTGIFLIVLSLLTVGQGVFFTYQNRQITKCQADYNEQFIAQLRARSEISESDRESLAKMLGQMLTLADREDRRKALEDYLETKERNDEQRKEHPLPELPTTAHC